jgi:indolepyruvate ferredoxin oxidoreductase alpha subunit
VYTVIAKLGVRVTGDIGCYTMGAMEPWNAIDSVVCMGASIGMALGMEKALGRIQVVKSWRLSVMERCCIQGSRRSLDLVYNQGHITVLIMDNSTTAMTGMQGTSWKRPHGTRCGGSGGQPGEVV